MGGSGADFAEAGFRMPKPLVTGRFLQQGGMFSIEANSKEIQEKDIRTLQERNQFFPSNSGKYPNIT